jgi:hypothetical protein
MYFFPTIGGLACVVLVATAAGGYEPFEQAPVEYSKSVPDNLVSALQVQLDAGTFALEYHDRLGYLPSLLEALGVSAESQALVFSQTSLQRHRISPRTPRAVYFGDEAYVGFCQRGDVLEISAVDSQLGAVFYTLDQAEVERPQLVRQTDSCLICHSSSRTQGVPGHLVRSLFVDSRGQPILSEGSFAVDYRTPFKDRWGGWYVTGTHGSQTHLGNLIVQGRLVSRPVENAQGQNVTQLDDRLAVSKYLTPHSDIVALMVLEHQTLVHNCLTNANYTARQALHYEQEMNLALGDPLDKRLESTERRIRQAGDRLVAALFFADEARLTAPIEGTSGFAEAFAASGPRDRQGRSLRDFDLKRRLFKYPCSYLIGSRAFAGLPEEMRDYVWDRVRSILHDPTIEVAGADLSADDRQAILEILRDTMPDSSPLLAVPVP